MLQVIIEMFNDTVTKQLFYILRPNFSTNAVQNFFFLFRLSYVASLL